MSELNIKINIPERGKTVGTLAWLKNELEHAEFEVTSCDGNPAISYKLKDDKEYSFLMFKGDNIDVKNCCISTYNYNTQYDFSYLYAEKCVCDAPEFGCYIFEYLTKSSNIFLNDFLEKMMEEFDKYLDDEEEVKDIDADIKLTFISK